MQLNVDYKIIGTVPYTIIQDFLDHIDEQDWFKDDYRALAGNMSDTNSIPLVHSKVCGTDGSINCIRQIEERILYQKYLPYLAPFVEELRKYYVFNRYAVFISRLKANGTIGAHPDTGLFLELCHRVHIPLQSNPDVKYVINGNSYFWKPGNIYEFNNTLVHGVYNESLHDRVHLVFNLYNLTDEEIDTGILSEQSKKMLTEHTLYRYNNNLL